MEEEYTKDIQDYLIAIKKRKVAMLSIFMVIIFFIVSIAFLLPEKYKSSSTILIEQQEIPRELVMSTVTSYAAERIQTIQARVMTRTNLLKIVDKFNLYEDERRFETNGKIISRMHKDVSLDLISSDVMDPRSGRASAATIAFSLSYQGESPAKVQRVANELTTLYLNENLTNRMQKASETSVFFSEEAERLASKINTLETKLALFKQKHAKALPELQRLNLDVIQRKEGETTRLDARLRALDDKKLYLESQLALISPTDTTVPGSAERLKTLQAEFFSVKSRYSKNHPDIIRLKSEIQSLEEELGDSDGSKAIAEERAALMAELAQKQLKYTGNHPDIVTLEEKINSLGSALVTIKSNPADNYSTAQPDNPAYISVKSQLTAADNEIKSVRGQRQKVMDSISDLEKTLYEAPQVEREYLVLKRDYENAVGRYQETKVKQMRADVAKQLESESKGERFTLIDPAILPEVPISPNRPAIIFLGLVLALGSSLGFAIVADAISGTVRGARGLRKAYGVLPLSIIPYEMNLQDRMKTKRIKKRIVLLFVAVIVCALLLIHLFVSPLDVLWFRILRKIDILMA